MPGRASRASPDASTTATEGSVSQICKESSYQSYVCDWRCDVNDFPCSRFQDTVVRNGSSSGKRPEEQDFVESSKDKCQKLQWVFQFPM